jgi:hypothetical protein
MIHAKTLFCQSPGRAAVLVSNRRGKMSKRVKRFRDGHAALDWCEKNGVILIYMPAENHSGN